MSDSNISSVDPSVNTHIGLETETVVIFVVLAVCALLVDLWAHRKDQPIALKTAIAWTVFWICVSMSFAVFLYVHFNGEVASLFLAGYLFEQALSVDNLFVIMAIFAWFKVPERYTHRVLYWGVLGAIFFRLIFVVIGSTLFALGPYVELVFALMVLGSGVMMLRSKESDSEENQDYSNHIAFKVVRWFFPVFPRLVGHNFFINHAHANEELKKPENKDLVLKRVGPIFATPLFLCLAVIETSDVLFAFDSVPAVIAVSREPLIIYSAMMFAVLGLRSLYFVLDALRQYLIHLEKAVIFLLFFIAFKLAAGALKHLTGFGLDISVYTSLLVIAVILGLGVLASFVFPAKKENQAALAQDGLETQVASESLDNIGVETAVGTAIPRDTEELEQEQKAQAQAQSQAQAETAGLAGVKAEISAQMQSQLQTQAQAAQLAGAEGNAAGLSGHGPDSQVQSSAIKPECVDNNPQAPIMGDAATSVPPSVEMEILEKSLEEQSGAKGQAAAQNDKLQDGEPTIADAATTVPPDIIKK